MPALVVFGTADAFTTRDEAQQMADLLPDAELVLVEGVGHMPNLEAAPAFNSAVQRLLDRVASNR